ncbi:sugar ABC transporter ATP-binding protein [Thalassospira alkalitolerans]|uniref:sugar ABC transporter ATP-binding protein n=1 Tax=Thalassospira alkalitolerans TaxID=1293890 RepID=UPI0030EBDE33|tara:strand:+ start:74033 stop:75577 length:1545 start_codon:yes stop_codon:yes gene_type:complete
MQPILEVHDIHKSFGPVQALRGVKLSLKPGEVHALMGENGAGKSTLMNILSGVLRPDHGRITFKGNDIILPDPATAQAHGIGLVHQEIALCPDISVAENILMAATNARKSFLMNDRELRERARTVLADLVPIPVDEKVGNLPIASQQIVEIAKALTLDCDILIFDEPTAALTETEAEALFRIIAKLKARNIGIIYISHRMAEIFAISDRITIFRDGTFVDTLMTADTNPDDVATKMVGREILNQFPAKNRDLNDKTPSLLSVRNLSDDDMLHDISFDLRKGEVLGLGGLIGSGRTETAHAICGLAKKSAGSLLLHGKPVEIDVYTDSIRNGLVYLSEDRKGSGVFLDLPIATNITALDLSHVSAKGFVRQRREEKRAVELGRLLSLRCAHVRQPVSSLSGGNQQKVAIAKMLSVHPGIIIFDEPTRGVDVGAKSEIYTILRNLAADGVGVLVISSELPELIGLCDRILVLHEGHIAGEVQDDRMTEEEIMKLASGLGTGMARQRTVATMGGVEP